MGIKNIKIKEYKMRYAGSRKGKGVTITLPFDPRKGKCEACGKSKKMGEIKSTALHHWFYAYQPKTVKKNPLLALENTTELCYYCHTQIADPIRALLYANPKRVAWVVKCLDRKQREKFVKVLESIVETLRQTEKNVSPLAKKILEMSKK